MDATNTGGDSIWEITLGIGLFQPRSIRARIDKLQWVGRTHGGFRLLPRSLIDEDGDVLVGTNTEMMITRLARVGGRLQLLAVDHGRTLRALCPESIGHFSPGIR